MKRNDRLLRVVFMPNWRDNPYLDLLAGALRSEGVVADDEGPATPYLAWLWRNRRRVDILHFHWPEAFYNVSGVLPATARTILFAIQLVAARLLGYRIVWTYHDLGPHESRYRVLDRIVWWYMANAAHAVITHCPTDVKKPTYSVPLGHYQGVHGDPVARDRAEARLGLDPRRARFLFVGSLRPYKGVESLLEAFRQIEGCDLGLLVAGSPKTKAYGDSLARLAAVDPRVRFDAGWIPDDEMVAMLGACDAVVLPFSGILNSSSAVLAMSYARPVVAPAIGGLPHLLDPTCGILYEADRPGALREALEHAAACDLRAMGQQAYHRALSWSWADVAKVSRAAYVGETVYTVNGDMPS